MNKTFKEAVDKEIKEMSKRLISQENNYIRDEVETIIRRVIDSGDILIERTGTKIEGTSFGYGIHVSYIPYRQCIELGRENAELRSENEELRKKLEAVHNALQITR